jgi:transcriptional regulator with XRE-family HTH domain
MMSSLAARLKSVFDPAKHSQAEIARVCEVKPSSVADWFSGESKSIKAVPLLKAAAYLDVSPLWLAAGEGPKRPRPGAYPPAEPATVLTARERAATPESEIFPMLDFGKIRKLRKDQLHRLEGALLLTAAQLQLDIEKRDAA